MRNENRYKMNRPVESSKESTIGDRERITSQPSHFNIVDLSPLKAELDEFERWILSKKAALD